MFSIITTADFFGKVKQDLFELESDIANPSKAMNSILSTYHMHDWIWAHWLKDKAPIGFHGISIKTKSNFVAWLESQLPHFKLLQQLSNGTKHCAPVHSTSQIEGFGIGPYGIGPYGMPYLLIDLGDDIAINERYLVASEMLSQAVKFWEFFLLEQGIITI